VALRLQARARVNQQRTADAGGFRLDESVGAEPVGETKVLIADQLDSGEEVVDVCDMRVGRRQPGDGERLIGGAEVAGNVVISCLCCCMTGRF